MSNNDKESVLVLLATGKMGLGVCDAFVASDHYRVFGTTRHASNPILVERGVTPVEFTFGSTQSIENALSISKPSVVVVITELIHIAKKPEVEVQYAKIILDACKEHAVAHVILCSSNLCEVGPEEARHLKTKLKMERYLKSKDSDIKCWTILRPGSFFENYNDRANMNPLKRGRLSDLFDATTQIPLVATRDIGNAAVLVAEHPKQWNGQTLDCVSSLQSGNDCAAILSEVSGLPCVYTPAPSRFILKWFLPDLYYMVQYMANGLPGYDCREDIEKFRALVPNAMGPREWFTALGTWSDGTKFQDAPPKRSNLVAYVLLSAPLVLLAIVVAVELQK